MNFMLSVENSLYFFLFFFEKSQLLADFCCFLGVFVGLGIDSFFVVIDGMVMEDGKFKFA